MKKIYSTILFLLASIILLTACTSENNIQKTSEIPDTSESTTAEKTLFQKFEEELTNNGYDYEKDIQWASMIGAKEGIGYRLTTGGSAELYIYDKESEAYKAAERAQAIVYINECVSGDSAIVKNGAALLMIDLDNSKAKEIEEIFNSVVS